jgi:TonB family protein
MLVRATRTLSALTVRGLFYGGLFVLVVVLHLGLTGALRGLGAGPSVSLFVSGVIILALVLVLVNASDWLTERTDAHREMQRLRQHLPSGSCCVIWRASDPAARAEAAMPWELASPLRARYPKLARRLGIEGVAIVEFEIAAGGKAKNIECIDVWPSVVFYDAARQALELAVFQPKQDEHVRFGASYRIPFVFRIAGAADVSDNGVRADMLRLGEGTALRLAEKLRQAG